jgi:secondary thiamine-phosphate synthase enzyme
LSSLGKSEFFSTLLVTGLDPLLGQLKDEGRGAGPSRAEPVVRNVPHRISRDKNRARQYILRRPERWQGIVAYRRRWQWAIFRVKTSSQRVHPRQPEGDDRLAAIKISEGSSSRLWRSPVAEFNIRTRKKQEMVDVTGRLADLVKQSGISDGICLVYVPHATAAVVINENADPNVCEDILDALAGLVPDGKWRHDRIDENAAAHIKATILGPSEAVPVKGGRLRLGTWQSIMLVELDGPRDRTVIVEVR